MKINSIKTKGLIRVLLFANILLCGVFSIAGAVPSLLVHGLVTRGDIVFLSFLNTFNPDIAVELAKSQREGLNREYVDEQLLVESSSLRPYWPYYQLELLYVQILNHDDVDLIRLTFDKVISLGAHERGIDVGIIPMSFMVWTSLREDQIGWVMSRMNTARQSTTTNLIKVSEDYGLKWYLCSKLQWIQVARACRGD
ncbi:hypothetical protein [Oceanobacter antarcticus]|uniref:Uncharacterized protein n=1 Tax=Oceanobacter antarcticus TaxID=3133425 RepID=A0ABW8NI21_9GAMM